MDIFAKLSRLPHLTELRLHKGKFHLSSLDQATRVAPFSGMRVLRLSDIGVFDDSSLERVCGVLSFLFPALQQLYWKRFSLLLDITPHLVLFTNLRKHQITYF